MYPINFVFDFRSLLSAASEPYRLPACFIYSFLNSFYCFIFIIFVYLLRARFTQQIREPCLQIFTKNKNTLQFCLKIQLERKKHFKDVKVCFFLTSVRRTENVACRSGSHCEILLPEPNGLRLDSPPLPDIGNPTTECHYRYCSTNSRLT